MMNIQTDEEAAKYAAENFQDEHVSFESARVNDRYSELTGTTIWRLSPGNLGSAHYLTKDGKYFMVGTNPSSKTDEAILQSFRQARAATE